MVSQAGQASARRCHQTKTIQRMAGMNDSVWGNARVPWMVTCPNGHLFSKKDAGEGGRKMREGEKCPNCELVWTAIEAVSK